MDSDSSDFIDTTYSADERIEKELEEEKQKRKERAETLQNARKNAFETFIRENPENDISQLQGFHLYVFTHLKIKFGFNPSEVAHVSRKIKFVTVLKYTGRYWILGRNTIPVNWSNKIHKMFTQEKKSIMDRDLIDTIKDIHAIFLEWSEVHENFMTMRMKKYRDGQIEFFDLTSEDEEVFLDADERRELRQKRDKILRRMIPPKKNFRKMPRNLEKTKYKLRMSPTLHLDSE